MRVYDRCSGFIESADHIHQAFTLSEQDWGIQYKNFNKDNQIHIVDIRYYTIVWMSRVFRIL